MGLARLTFRQGKEEEEEEKELRKDEEKEGSVWNGNNLVRSFLCLQFGVTRLFSCLAYAMRVCIPSFLPLSPALPRSGQVCDGALRRLLLERKTRKCSRTRKKKMKKTTRKENILSVPCLSFFPFSLICSSRQILFLFLSFVSRNSLSASLPSR